MSRPLNWYFSKTYLWGRSLANLKSNDLLLAAYPKTGSTWVRYFLYSLLLQNKSEDIKPTIDSMNYSMPEFAHPSFFLEWSFKECPRIVKTHQKCYKFFKGKKTALIIRDPRDVFVSYFHHINGLKTTKFDCTIKDILRDPKIGLKAFFHHYLSWVSYADLILRYEDLRKKPLEGFSQLAEYYGIMRSEKEVQDAVNISSFLNMRTVQQDSFQLKNEFKDGHQFMRSGQKAQWKKIFSEDDTIYYESVKEKYHFNLYS